jgi:hypothetical protein
VLEADLAGAGFRVEHRFGSFLTTIPNSMTMGCPEALLKALDAISDSLPPEILATIGVRAAPAGPESVPSRGARARHLVRIWRADSPSTTT